MKWVLNIQTIWGMFLNEALGSRMHWGRRQAWEATQLDTILHADGRQCPEQKSMPLDA